MKAASLTFQTFCRKPGPSPASLLGVPNSTESGCLMGTRLKLLVVLALIGAALVAALALVTRTMWPTDLLRLLAGEPALSDCRAEEVRVCIAGKEAVTDELLAGRLGLGEAADHFGRLE